ncbi:tetratricopeptide (TPR) repeat protein [Spirosoma lacussanchae]|uniref:caspase family protein n=1 Tax=Spirosoma lacussanchae TaxID=1884249 RepID=UPI00110896C2|nr:caspase family protein [Spirosoma lacussanchae]
MKYFTLCLLCLIVALPAKAQFGKVRGLLDRGRYNEARTLVDEATETNPNAPEGWYYRGVVYQAIATVSDTTPQYADAALVAYESFQKAVLLPGASVNLKDDIRKALSDNALSTLLLRAGAFRYKDKEFSKALQLMSYAHKVSPKDTLALLYAGITALNIDSTASMSFFETYIQNGGRDAGIFYALALSYSKKGDTDRALRTLERGSELLPGNVDLRSEYVNTLLRSGRSEEALQRLILLLEQDPLNATNVLNVGILYDNISTKNQETLKQMLGKKGSESISDLEEFRRLTLTQRTQCYLYYKRALDLSPTNYDALYNMAVFYFNLAVEQKRLVDAMTTAEYKLNGKEKEKQVCGLFASALPYFERAEKLNKNDPELPKNIATLRDVLKRFADYKTPCTPITYQQQTVGDYTSPDLTITEPVFLDGAYTTSQTGNRLTLRGKASDNDRIALMQINGSPVKLAADNSFAHELTLRPGLNRLSIRVTDASRNTIQRDLTVYNQAAVSFTTGSKGRFFALLISVQTYQDILLPSLSEPHNDARRLAATLIQHYGFDSTRVIHLQDPTRADLLDELDDLVSRIREDDKLLVFFSGHGQFDPVTQQGYWMLRDASRRRGTWINNAEIQQSLNAIPARHLLLISDACFSGSMIAKSEVAAGTAIDLLSQPGRTVMTSGSLTAVPERSLFSDYMLRRLNQNKEKYLSASRLFYSFREAVMKESRLKNQVPQYGVFAGQEDKGGEFVFIRQQP